MTIIDNNSIEISDENIRLYLEDLSLRSWYNRKPVVVYLSMVAIVGFMGNTWCFLVYFFCFKANSTRVFVLAMSICDLVTNVVALPLQIYTIRHAYDSYDVPLCRSMFVFATIPTQLSGFLILLVAFDRYRRICKSFAPKITAEQAAKLIAVAVFLIFALFLPFTCLYGYHTADSPRPGVKAVMCWVHDGHSGDLYGRTYLIVVCTCFFVGLIALVALYSLIAVTIFRHRFSITVRVRSVTVVYPNPTTGQSLLSSFRKRSSTDCILKGAGKAEEKDDSVESQDDKSKDAKDSNTGMKTTLTGEDIGRLDSLPSCAPDANKETRLQNVKDSLDSYDRERIVNRKVTIGGVSVIGDKKKSEFMEGYESPSEPSEEEIVLVEPEVNQVGPVKSTTETTYTTRKIFRISEVHNSRRIQFQTTIMMAVLAAFYVINWLPHLIARLLTNRPVNMCDNFTDCGYNIYAISLRSYYLHSAVNAFIYSFCNSKFRQESRNMFSKISNSCKRLNPCGHRLHPRP